MSMIRTWIADVTPLKEKEKYQYYYEQVPIYRQEKADRILQPEDKALSVGAWVLLDYARCEAGIHDSAVFNLSHSGDYVMCSIDDSGQEGVKVGCDIQQMKELRQRIAKRFFCPSELDYINAREAENEKRELFYRYWTLKESFMKATRLGMKLGLDEFEIQIDDENVPRLIRQPQYIIEKYYYKEYLLGDIPYKAAVCSTEADIAEDVERVLF